MNQTVFLMNRDLWLAKHGIIKTTILPTDINQ